MKKKKGRNLTTPPGMHAGGRCPYCGSAITLRSAEGIYRENGNGTMLYVCSRYPECDAYVRVQSGTSAIPLGSMANGDLRALRIEAHRHFNQLYLSGLMTKRQAYSWLSDQISAPLSQAHIGYLGEYYCKVVIEESKRFIENNRQRIAHRSTRQRLQLVSGGERYAAE